MHPRDVGTFEKYRRAWWQRRGEQPVVTTFGRSTNYRRGTYCWNGSRCYQITRYVRAADPQFFEVWGKEVQRCTCPKE